MVNVKRIIVFVSGHHQSMLSENVVESGQKLVDFFGNLIAIENDSGKHESIIVSQSLLERVEALKVLNRSLWDLANLVHIAVNDMLSIIDFFHSKSVLFVLSWEYAVDSTRLRFFLTNHVVG